MSKKDEAFELFSQGKEKNDPEVVALGLTKDSIRKYHREWSKLYLEAPEKVEKIPVEEAPTIEAPKATTKAPVTVSIRSLPSGAQFELAGRRYQKLGAQVGKVVCLHLTSPRLGWIAVSQKAFEAGTLVIPK